MDYTKLNEVLKDLNTLRRTKMIGIETIKKIDCDYPQQGEEGLFYEVYSLPFEKEVFLKLTISTNSYGEGERITGIEFVKETTKTVKTYERV